DGIAQDGKVTWQHALDYIKKLNSENYLGFSDWRLPNNNEIASLLNSEQSDQATWLNSQGFSNFQIEVWSSTTDARAPDNAGCGLGYLGSYHKNLNYAYVLPVRNYSIFYLPKTGQITCYNSNGTTISCAGTGQDGEIQAGLNWPSPRLS